MMNSRFIPNRSDVSTAIARCIPEAAADPALLRRATGAAMRAMLGAGDTGAWHGPREEHTYNDRETSASWRRERHAKDLRDIGALRELARMADDCGAVSVAKHLRELASIFAESAAIEGYCAMSSAGALTSERDPDPALGPIGPVLGAVYLPTDDMFADVFSVSAETDAVYARHPMGYMIDASIGTGAITHDPTHVLERAIERADHARIALKS